MGHPVTAEARERISQKAKERDMTDLCKMGTDAAKKSPKSGRFETNINAKDWHLISPEGRHYHFRSLNNWMRINGKELFGCDPDTREFRNACSGLSGAKRAMRGSYGSCTYKGWQVIPVEEKTNEY